ncbi:ABC-type polysaccharide/polyol phosphate transport system, ATPase component [Pelotomaculum thermopropionicum SI]|uniref:ABC-type polysaccharide/polyol phosphate transport system, ATPase component n=1 Tax=Pelotomaculum thermopropionicum (strain DSM 13744 / JCM 10971 / SI) TaxID=370438 RepID=A5CZ09_PELTS|nr:ABC-type polysaccharide/polyol phosphate transport system, ATPase component [Pelotomaculum thermopropionicum SI]
MYAVKLENVSLTFDINKSTTLKDIFLSLWGKKNCYNTLQKRKIAALKEINLELRQGDRLGIIGLNGAGKSTLLKVVAGIYPPTSGNVSVNGRVTCLFELATGFEMEATGWENIYLRGLMLGATPREMKKKALEIAEFSGLGDYLDLPVRHYSSGMFIRLAFSVSTSIEPEILLLDEVVAAGDASFLAKAEKRLKDLMGRVKVLLFVSHNMQSIKDFCNRAIWLDRGKIRAEGLPDDVIKKYLGSINNTDKKRGSVDETNTCVEACI